MCVQPTVDAPLGRLGCLQDRKRETFRDPGVHRYPMRCARFRKNERGNPCAATRPIWNAKLSWPKRSSITSGGARTARWSPASCDGTSKANGARRPGNLARIASTSLSAPAAYRRAESDRFATGAFQFACAQSRPRRFRRFPIFHESLPPLPSRHGRHAIIAGYDERSGQSARQSHLA